MPLVSISDSQRRPLPWANWRATVHHGLPADLFSFHEHPDDYWAFLGRISPDKGLDKAIAIALAAGKKLKVAAKIYPEDQAYYQQVIVPLMHDAGSHVEFVGEVAGRPRKRSWAGRRACSFRSTGRTVRPGDDRGDGVRHARRRVFVAVRCPK